MPKTGIDVVKVTYNIVLIYSTDDNRYYFENRDPDNWRTSIKSYLTRADAMRDYNHGAIVWENS